MRMLKKARYWLWPAVLLVGADGFILANTPVPFRFAAALILLAFLPGWVWADVFTYPHRLIPLAQVTLAVGLSLALTVFSLIFTVYLAGGLAAMQVLLALNLVMLAGLLVAGWLRRSRSAGPGLPTTKKWAVAALLVGAALLVLALALRLPRLGYAEFHEDEAEALMLGVRLLRGEAYALFLHRKGPAQMLVPVAFWLLTGRITEALARAAFALSSALSVITVFLLGRRWFNWPAGAIAALLWAVNGYAIGFGRMVQYQALIFFWGPLALFTLFVAWREQRPWLQVPAALLLAASLLAHFDALLLLPVAGYLGWLIVSRAKTGTDRRRVVLISAFSLGLFLLLLAAFYIPFVLDPEFKNTANYLSQSRVKPGLLYNNLDVLRRLDRDYSSRFYVPALLAGLVGYLLLAYRRHRLVLLGLGGLALSAAMWPAGWQVGSMSLAVLPWLLLIGAAFWLATAPAEKAAWLLVGAPLIGYVFLVDDPRTHLYIIYPGAVLLAGAGWARFFGYRRLRWPAAGVGVVLLGAVLVYVVSIFLPTESTYARLRRQWDGSIWAQVYRDIPEPRQYFGYPKREGWKTIGVLRANGQIPGDFRSVNEEFIIPIWYNFGQARSCYDTPAQVFIRLTGLDAVELREGYRRSGQVEREGEIRIAIASRENLAPPTPETFVAERFVSAFDRLATPAQFIRQNEPHHHVGTQFGPAIEFEGFDLSATRVAPGDTIYLNLYWRAVAAPAQNYRAFVHLTDGATLWAQQDDTPACRLPTTIWRAGQHAVGQFRLTVNPDTPPGRYPLVIGLYQAGTLERLKITGGAGQPGDDFLWLGDIDVTPGR